MSVPKILTAKVPLAAVVVTLAIFALWIAFSMESSWMPDGSEHHRISFGVLSYSDVELDRGDPSGSWSVAWGVAEWRLLATLLLTAPVIWYGRRAARRLAHLEPTARRR